MDNVKMVDTYIDGSQQIALLNGITQTGQWTNCAVLYLWFEAPGGSVRFTDVDATGSRIYGIIETDYCVSQPAVIFENTVGLTYGNGDTERPNSPTGVYQFKNCRDFTLVCHRNFHSHGDACATTLGKGYYVEGGENITFFGIQEIGDNAEYSLHVKESDNFRIYGMFLEDSHLWENCANPLRTFYTVSGFGDAPAKKWSAPAKRKPASLPAVIFRHSYSRTMKQCCVR